jgi:hypothetical protein
MPRMTRMRSCGPHFGNLPPADLHRDRAQRPAEIAAGLPARAASRYAARRCFRFIADPAELPPNGEAESLRD